MPRFDLVVRRFDVVRIEDPRPVIRVGYPKTPEDFLPEVRQQHEASLCAIFGVPVPPSGSLEPLLEREDAHRNRYVERALRDLAYLACRRAGFGGTEREIHFGEPVPELKGRLANVSELRTFKTGTYSPGWEAPATLEKERTWRLASLDVRGTGFLTFPVSHLTKMSPCQTCAHRALEDRRYIHPFEPECCYFCAQPFAPVSSGETNRKK